MAISKIHQCASSGIPCSASPAPDQFIAFIFLTGDRTVPTVGWDRWFAMDEAERPHTRNDTVRHWRPSTSQPAIAAILEHLPPSSSARVIAEVGSPEDEYPLDSDADVEITWLYRGDRHAGESQTLIETIRAVQLPDVVRYAWGGGEFRTMQAIGRYLRHECGFRPSDVATIGYW